MQNMTLYVRLSGPQVTLQRQKRGLAICPKLRRGGLLPSLSLMFLSVAIASLGFFVITEVGIVQRTQVGDRLLRRLRHSTLVQSLPTVSTSRGDFFKINPLLNKNAPSVELSAQMTLNAIYCNNIRQDILNYYESVRCKDFKNENFTRENQTRECSNFSLVQKGSQRKEWWSMKPCPLYPSNLIGQRKVAADEFLSINRIDPIVLKAIKHGGWWEPNDCLPRHSVAIVIPYKDRWLHLTTLLNYLHPLLQKQKVKYKIFVVEQYGNETFNKGTIMNAAFIEALKEELFHCFIFHDVDLIPENDYNMYSCPQMPRHLSVAVNELNYKLPYAELVGGAFAIRTEHFFKVNGYSNFFWGWGGEDDDMGLRVLQSGLSIIRPLPSLGKYTMIKHVKRKPSDARIRRRLLATSRKRYRLEGLNSVQYRLLKKKKFPWFTAFLVDIGKPHPSFNLGKKD